MEGRAIIEVNFNSGTEAQTVLKALEPELTSAPSDKAKVTLDVKGKTLFLNVSSSERSAFRAAVNTYLRWIRTAHEVGGI
jgi:tRNA threonylcarbamoyladenosine modification (KEOPS) complex  Pcc1 subunit